MKTYKKSILRLPKLKLKDELLKTSPELAKFLVEDPELHEKDQPYKLAGGLANSTSPSRLPFLEIDITEEEELRNELEQVKHERANLLESLAKLRLDEGKSGGDLQQEDIKILRNEIEAKTEKINQLSINTRRLMESLEQLDLTSKECDQLMPQVMQDAESRVQQLTNELAQVESSILESEAKNELYKLLESRTRRDHQNSKQQQRDLRQLKDDAMCDYTTLTKHMHEMRASKEDAERELGAAVAMFDQVKGDWQKKLKDRRKEVQDMEQQKADEKHRQEQQKAVQEEKERMERAKAAKLKHEIEAQEARASKFLPQLEELESQWARVHAITGAETADDVINHWRDLKQKENNMQELVKLAEVREARAKEGMVRLLEARADIYHAADANQETVDGAEEARTDALTAEGSSNAIDKRAQEIEDVTRRKHTARKKFNKLSHICIAVDQGLHLLFNRLQAALENAPRIMAEASERRSTLGGGTRRHTRRTSNMRRVSASAFLESRRNSLVGTAGSVRVRETVLSYQPGGSSVNDKDFFPGLPNLLQEVGERLDKLLALAADLEAAERLGESMFDSETANGETSSLSLGSSSKRSGVATPRATTGGSLGGDEEMLPKHEAALCKRFRRDTLAGPPWLNSVAAKASACSSSRRCASARTATARPAVQPHIERTVGYAEDPQESSDEDPFSLDSSDDEDPVLDRELLKHRAEKLVKSMKTDGQAV